MTTPREKAAAACIILFSILSFALGHFSASPLVELNDNLERIAVQIYLMNETMEDGLPMNQVSKDKYETLENELSRVCFTLGYGRVGAELRGNEIDSPTLMASAMRSDLTDRIRETLDLCVNNFPHMFQ